MARQKKISIKFYLNKNLKGRVLTDDLGNKSYPLYIRVTYDRKNTTFKYVTPFAQGGTSVSEIFEDDINDFQKFPIHKLYVDFLEKIIRQEIKKRGDKFSIKGINDRLLLHYTESVNRVLDNILNAELMEILRKSLTYNKYSIVDEKKDFWERYRTCLQWTDEINFSNDFVKLLYAYLIVTDFYYKIEKEKAPVTYITPFGWLTSGSHKKVFIQYYDSLIEFYKKKGEKWFNFLGIMKVDVLFMEKMKNGIINFIDDVANRMLQGYTLFFSRIYK